MRNIQDRLNLLTRYLQTFCDLVTVEKEDFLVVVSSRKLHAITWKSCENIMQTILDKSKDRSFTANDIECAIENFRVNSGCPSFAEIEMKLAIAGVQVK